MILTIRRLAVPDLVYVAAAFLMPYSKIRAVPELPVHNL